MINLDLKIDASGNRAGLYKGPLLVVGFKWRERVKAFDIIGSTPEWDDLILHDKAFQKYLDHVLIMLEAYRGEASKLAIQKKALERILSGFVF